MSYPGQGHHGAQNHHGSGRPPYQGYQQGYQPGYQQGYQQSYAPPPGPPPPGPGYGGGSGGGYGYAPPNGPPPQYSHAPPNYPPPGQYRPRGGQPPPSNPQQFGHGAPSNYMFEYSRCTGKRKALLIGINYFGQKGELKGCINDVQNLSRFLMERYNYKREDMVILTDDQRNPVAIPTRANMIRAMQWLVKDARKDDSLFLHYSGERRPPPPYGACVGWLTCSQQVTAVKPGTSMATRMTDMTRLYTPSTTRRRATLSTTISTPSASAPSAPVSA